MHFDFSKITLEKFIELFQNIYHYQLSFSVLFTYGTNLLPIKVLQNKKNIAYYIGWILVQVDCCFGRHSINILH